MNLNDLYLLSPELSIAGLAAVLVILDLTFHKKSLLPIVAVVGLIVPLLFTLQLWSDLGDPTTTELTGLFGSLAVDKFSLFFKFLFIGVAGLTILYSTEYSKNFERFRGEYYALILFATTGMMLLAATTELITIYISLELTALPLVALTGFLKTGRSSESAMKFLVLSGISSAILLYGMVIVYGFTGSTSLALIADQIGRFSADPSLINTTSSFGSPALLFGIVLMIAGFGFKISSVPFQMWAPDVYEGAPTTVTGFLSVASKAAGFAIILRVFYTAFSADILSLEWGAAFAVISVLSMSLGNFVAILQTNIKRLLAYSTIAQAGYMLVGLAAISARTDSADAGLGPSGLLFYLAGYAITNLAVFSVVIAISNKIKSDDIADYSGMSRRSPILAGVLALGLISLTGVPPTVGFMAKIYIFSAAIDTNLEWLALAGVINSVISAYYYLNIVRKMYLDPPPSEEPIGPGMPMKFAVGITFAATLFFGIYPTPLIQLARAAAEVLLI